MNAIPRAFLFAGFILTQLFFFGETVKNPSVFEQGRGVELLPVYLPIEESLEPIWLVVDHDLETVWRLDGKVLGKERPVARIEAPVLLDRSEGVFRVRYRGETHLFRPLASRRARDVVLIPDPVSGLAEVMDAESEFNKESRQRSMEAIRREAKAVSDR